MKEQLNTIVKSYAKSNPKWNIFSIRYQDLCDLGMRQGGSSPLIFSCVLCSHMGLHKCQDAQI